MRYRPFKDHKFFETVTVKLQARFNTQRNKLKVTMTPFSSHFYVHIFFFLGLQLLLALTTEATEYFSWIAYEAYEYSINLLFCYLFHEERINMATEFLNMKAILEFRVLSKKDPFMSTVAKQQK